MSRRHHASGAPWETTVGYSRAVRVGPVIHVAGTTAVDGSGQIVAPGDAYAQGVYAFEKGLRAIVALGGTVAHVTRTRMYVTDIVRDGEAVGRAHRETVGEARPAATMVEVSRLIEPGLVVEIEMEAWVEGSEPDSGA